MGTLRVKAVCFLLFKDGRVLMERCSKKAERLGGEWFIPGGRIELSDTSTFDSLIREMEEELGCSPSNCEALSLVDACGPTDPPFLMRPYLVRKWHGTIPTHCLDQTDNLLRWVPVEEARQSPVTVIRQILVAVQNMKIES